MAEPTILIVDDEPLILEEMAELLGIEGYAVVSAESFDEALALVARHKKLRLVITDARMPGKSGFELVTCLQGRNLAFILLSGHLAFDFVTFGAVPILRKPIDITAFLHEVDAIMRR